MSKADTRRRIRAYILGGVVTGIFFTFWFGVLIVFAPMDASFLYLEVFFLLPFSPLFVVWLYFLFRAVVPITGGMPGKGFKKWFYSYLLLLLVLLYLAGITAALLALFPSFDRDYTEKIFPPAIIVITMFVVFRIPRVNRFMWRVFGEKPENQASQQ